MNSACMIPIVFTEPGAGTKSSLWDFSVNLLKCTSDLQARSADGLRGKSALTLRQQTHFLIPFKSLSPSVLLVHNRASSVFAGRDSGR